MSKSSQLWAATSWAAQLKPHTPKNIAADRWARVWSGWACFLLYVSTISIILMNAFCPVVRNWDIWRETTHPCVLSWSNPEPRSAESAQISCCLSRFVDNPGEDNAQVCVAAWHCVILAVVLDLSDWSDEVLFRGICMAALLVLLLL